MAGTFPRLAIVTGAASGIGRAAALLLATDGFDIGLTVHSDTEGAVATAREVEHRGQRCVMASFDASSEDAGTTIDRLIDDLGGVGVLVNVAGTGHSQRVVDLDLQRWNHVLATDLTGPFLACQRVARVMVTGGHGGRIINVTSVHEHVPPAGRRRLLQCQGRSGAVDQGAGTRTWRAPDHRQLGGPR